MVVCPWVKVFLFFTGLALRLLDTLDGSPPIKSSLDFPPPSPFCVLQELLLFQEQLQGPGFRGSSAPDQHLRPDL